MRISGINGQFITLNEGQGDILSIHRSLDESEDSGKQIEMGG